MVTWRRNRKILVSINDTDYICNVSLIGTDYIALQDGKSLNAETGETDAVVFVIANRLYYKATGEYRVKITDYSAKYNKMPEGFLPEDNVPTKAYTNLSAKNSTGVYGIYATSDEYVEQR